MTRAATHEIFLSVATASTLLNAQETTTALLRGHSCFSYRVVILNKDKILSNYKKNGFRGNCRKFSDCRGYSQSV